VTAAGVLACGSPGARPPWEADLKDSALDLNFEQVGTSTTADGTVGAFDRGVRRPDARKATDKIQVTVSSGVTGLALNDRWTRAAVAAGVTVPLLYYGVQLAAAPFYPRYSFLAQDASDLGSDASTRPWLFCAGMIGVGVATLMAAWGFSRALRRAGTHFIAVLLLVAALVSSAAASMNAGIFPLPDPRHDPGALGAGLFLLPILFVVAAWTLEEARVLKAYLIANLALFLVMIPILFGVVDLDTEGLGGLLQRTTAATVFIPIGIVAGWLARRTSN